MIRTERGLWAVADGMGGHEAGDVASGKIAEALQRLPIVYDIVELVAAASAALLKINHELIVLARGEKPDRLALGGIEPAAQRDHLRPAHSATSPSKTRAAGPLIAIVLPGAQAMLRVPPGSLTLTGLATSFQ